MTDLIDTDRLKLILRDTECVYHGIRFSVHQQTLRASSGKRFTKEFVSHPGAVVILPILEKGEIVLIRNRRFAVGATLWELPAGTLEEGEEPEETAERELEEETGYRSSSIHPITKFFTTPGICNEVMHAFVAKGLSYFGQRLDDGEEIEVKIHTWEQIDTLIKNGEICDGKTLLTLLYYKTQFMDCFEKN